jgi:hypothetical protein
LSSALPGPLLTEAADLMSVMQKDFAEIVGRLQLVPLMMQILGTDRH